MKQIHSAMFTVFVKEGEDESAITKARCSLIPFDLTKEKIQLLLETVDVFEDRKIIILRIAVLHNF